MWKTNSFFEGEYNKKKIKGKEYNHLGKLGKLEFEGEYENNQRKKEKFIKIVQ